MTSSRLLHHHGQHQLHRRCRASGSACPRLCSLIVSDNGTELTSNAILSSVATSSSPEQLFSKARQIIEEWRITYDTPPALKPQLLTPTEFAARPNPGRNGNRFSSCSSQRCNRIRGRHVKPVSECPPPSLARHSPRKSWTSVRTRTHRPLTSI